MGAGEKWHILTRVWEFGNVYASLGEMQNGVATPKNDLTDLKKPTGPSRAVFKNIETGMSDSCWYTLFLEILLKVTKG